ncbi:MAG TPA: 4-alpha-glucanotransferase, partial [Dehalococcoidia bacterium]|nr:4-alpha-glucanotransferase [Dehalococcoidia bacterium]
MTPRTGSEGKAEGAAWLRRASGVLLHPTALPGPYGIGDLGNAAHRFIEFLRESAQGFW